MIRFRIAVGRRTGETVCRLYAAMNFCGGDLTTGPGETKELLNKSPQALSVIWGFDRQKICSPIRYVD